MKNPYLPPASLFLAGMILFAYFDGDPSSSWPMRIAQLLVGIGGLGTVWVWLGRNK